MVQQIFTPTLCSRGQQSIKNGLKSLELHIRESLASSVEIRYLTENPRVGTSENGWTDDEIGFIWFQDTFAPQAVERNRVETEKERHDSEIREEESTTHPPMPLIMLVYDGHGSHTTLKWITLARANNIILFCLPPHTTHCLQPLDVGCFGPLQIAWFNRCDEIMDETGEGMDMRDVVNEYFAARRKAFKPETI